MRDRPSLGRSPSLLQQACSLVGHAFRRGCRGTTQHPCFMSPQPVSTGFQCWSAFRRLDLHLRNAFQPILDTPRGVVLALALDLIDNPRQIALTERHNAVSGLPCQNAEAARAVIDLVGADSPAGAGRDHAAARHALQLHRRPVAGWVAGTQVPTLRFGQQPQRHGRDDL